MSDVQPASVTGAKNTTKSTPKCSTGKRGARPIPWGITYTVERANKNEGLCWHVFVKMNRLIVFDGMLKVKDAIGKRESHFLYSILKKKPGIRFWFFPNGSEEDYLVPDDFHPIYPCAEFAPIPDYEENVRKTWEYSDWMDLDLGIKQESEYSNLFGHPVDGRSEIEIFNGRDIFGIYACDGCGNMFEGPIKGDPRRQYCSDECRKKAYARKRRHFREGSRIIRLETLRCQNCGGLFEARAGAKFCSDRCRQAHHRRSKKH